MVWNILFWLGLATSLGIGVVYFRDLGDISQMVLKVKRRNMIRFIRNEYKFIGAGLAAAVVMAVTHLGFEAGPVWLFWTALVLVAFLYGFPWIWVHLGLRNQADKASFYSIEEATKFVAPASQVLVIENNGKARAHPDYEMMRPHLAGNDEGLDGENVVMTYCAMANLGLGYTHIYGQRERDGRGGPGMKPWPTFRMSFRGFQKAYPEGEVFLNPPSSNPFLRLLDMVTDPAFSIGISKQHREEKPVMDNMSHFDDRLPNKTYVWGVNMASTSETILSVIPRILLWKTATWSMR